MQSSLLGVEGEQKGMVGSCLKAAYTPAHGFPSSLSCAVVSDVSSGGLTCVNWIRNQLVRECRSELFLLGQQSLEPFFFLLKRSVYLFFYCRVSKDQLEDQYCIFHFGLLVKNISPSLLLVSDPRPSGRMRNTLWVSLTHHTPTRTPHMHTSRC